MSPRASRPAGETPAEPEIEELRARVRELEARLVEARLEETLSGETLSGAARSVLLAAMGHEIRIPLNGALGTNALLLATELSPEQRELAESVQASAESLLAIIDQVLDLSRIEAGPLPLEDVDFDLPAVITAAATVVRPAAQRRHLALRVRLDRGLPTAVRGDPQRLRQVLMNLLGNAVKFTERGSVMLRAVSMPDDGDGFIVQFEVVDTGVGISPEQSRRLSRPFEEPGPSAANRLGGTGLGLAISRQLIELMGGTIAVVSAPGEGSRFTFTVRLRPGDAGALEASGTGLDRVDADAPGMLAGRRILLADDHPANRDLAEAALRRFGAEVDVAVDGLEAVRRFEPGRYDAVVLDVRMPNTDGYDAAREMRRMEDEVLAPRTPILALTADAIAEDRERALAAGMDETLGKPFRIVDLGEMLTELIAASAEAAGSRPRARSRRDAAPGATEANAAESAAAVYAAEARANAARIKAATTRAPAPGGLGAPPDAGGTTSDATGETDPPWAGRPRVLVVDDNETNRRLAQVLLERLPVDATPVADGYAALDILAEQPFDLILLDGMMPGLDGPATAREIRRRERAAGVPPIAIVALTASILPEDRRRLLEAGMDDHVGKPFLAEDLERVLGTWLPRARRTTVIPSSARPERPDRGGQPADETVVDPVMFARLADLGDATFVDRIVRLFLADAAERVAQADEALEEGDVLRLRLALHALEGICGNVGAVALDRRAREIHDRIGRREDRGEEPLARAFGPSGLDELLDRTRTWFRESMADGPR